MVFILHTFLSAKVARLGLLAWLGPRNPSAPNDQSAPDDLSASANPKTPAIDRCSSQNAVENNLRIAQNSCAWLLMFAANNVG